MRSLIISAVLLVLLIIAIAVNSYYINSLSAELLDMVFTLPSETGYIKRLSELEIETIKSEINKISAKWEKNSARILLTARYSDCERINLQIIEVKEYFFAEYYADYLAARKKLIAALEKQKQNEMPGFDNIF
jgi:hypothetical protein